MKVVLHHNRWLKMKAVAAVLRTDFEQPLSGLIKLYIVMSRRARRNLKIVYFVFFPASLRY